MTTSPLETSALSMTHPAPEWLRVLAEVQARYQENFGWPVSLRIAERRLAVALGQGIDAITMPAELGARVHAQLGIAMLSGPVIAHPNGGHWTFLTQTASAMEGELTGDLAEHQVRHASAGAYTVIPAGHAEADWRWVAEPRPNQMLPSAHAVVATARRVCVR
jgi:hypothetical protein